MTNYTFTAGNNQPEDPKDTDLTHDSPHHTLGRGHTQAAPGNHTHKYADIIELPTIPSEGVTDHGMLTGLGDDDHGAYPLTNGTRATGTWPINISKNAATATNAVNATNATNAATSTRTGQGGLYISMGTTVVTTTASGTASINTGRTIEHSVVPVNGDWTAHKKTPQCDGWTASTFSCSDMLASTPIRIDWIVS